MSKPESKKKIDRKNPRLISLPIDRQTKKDKNTFVRSITAFVEDLEKQVKALTLDG